MGSFAGTSVANHINNRSGWHGGGYGHSNSYEDRGYDDRDFAPVRSCNPFALLLEFIQQVFTLLIIVGLGVWAIISFKRKRG